MPFDGAGNEIPVDQWGNPLPVPTEQIEAIEAIPSEPTPDLLGGVGTAVRNWMAPQQPLPGQRQSAGATVERQGMTPESVSNVHSFQAGLYGKGATAKKTDQMMAGRRAELSQVANAYGNANQLAKQAVDEGMEIESRYNDGLRQIHERQRDFLETQRHVEEQFYLHGQQERQKHVAAYQEQLGAIRQLVAMDANPLHNVDKGRAAGLGLAQAAQGFLAAQGIQIDVTGQIDKWVDRELTQHQAKIANTGKLAEGTLTLYNLARQNASDDYDARQRLRGFVIEGFKVHLMAEADRFNSDIGRAKAKAQIAALDKEQAATIERIGNTHFQQWHATYSGLVDEASKMGHLAIARDKAKLDAQAFQAQQDKARKDELRELSGRIDFDTSFDAVKNNKGVAPARWILKGNLKPTDAPVVDYQKDKATFATLEAQIAKLQDLQRQGGLGAFANSELMQRFRDDHAAEIIRLREGILSQYALGLSGKAVTDKEIERLRTAVPSQLWGQDYDANKILASTRNTWGDKLDQSRQSIYRPLEEGEVQELAKYNLHGQRYDHFNEQGYKYNEYAGRPDAARTPADEAIGAIRAPDAKTAASAEQLKKLNATDAQGYWDHFAANSGKDVARSPAADEGGALEQAMSGGLLGESTPSVFRTIFGSGGIFNRDDNAGVPVFAAGIVGVAKAAKSDSRAREELQRMAYGGLTAEEKNDPVAIATQEFARYMARQEGIDLNQNVTQPGQYRGLGTDRIFPVRRPDGRYTPGTVDEWGAQNNFGAGE